MQVNLWAKPQLPNLLFWGAYSAPVLWNENHYDPQREAEAIRRNNFRLTQIMKSTKDYTCNHSKRFIQGRKRGIVNAVAHKSRALAAMKYYLNNLLRGKKQRFKYEILAE